LNWSKNEISSSKDVLQYKIPKKGPILNIRLQQIGSKLKKSSFIKNVFIVMSGTALAQVLGFVLSPIISRLYSPSDFGAFGSFNAVMSIVAAGITLDYSQAIILPKKREEAFNIFVLSCLSTVLIGVCCLAICISAPASIQKLLKTNSVWIIVVLIAGILVTGINQACQAWNVRVKAFKYTSASQVVRSLTANGTQVGLGFLKNGAFGLIFASVLGDLLATLNLAKVVSRNFRELRTSVHWSLIKQLAKEYRDFPMYSASKNVINSLSLGLPIFILTHFYGIAVAGAYAFGMRLLQTPMGFVLTALRQVLYQKAAETHNNGERLVPLYLKITVGLFSVALLPSLVLFIWAPQIFSWVFGAQWRLAGVLAQSLILWLMFLFCNLPAVLFARIIRMQRKLFFFDLIVLIARALVLIAGGLYLSAPHTVMAFSIVGAVMNVIFIFIIGYALHKKECEPAMDEILGPMKKG
jgi:O-antigen/teichoic acid export membrane protein